MSLQPVPIPEEAFPARDWTQARRWRLPGYTRARAAALLADVEGAASHLLCDASGCTVPPPPASVAALSPAARSRLYTVLARIEGNPQADDTFYRATTFGPFSATPGLPAEARSLVDALTWRRAGVPAFSDIAAVCARLGPPARCHDFMRAMLSRTTASVRLLVGHEAAIERLVGMFPESARASTRDRLYAARNVGEGSVPLETLLPDWARLRLGTFPAVGEDWTNCFWTSLHFAGRAHGPVPDGATMEAALRRDFVQARDAARFGDVLVLRDAEGRPMHSATWLLGGYLFEKNGYGRLQAWRIVPLVEATSDHPEAASIELWRLREAPAP